MQSGIWGEGMHLKSTDQVERIYELLAWRKLQIAKEVVANTN